MNKQLYIAFLIVSSLAVSAISAVADEYTKKSTLRAYPLPNTKSFWLTEFSYLNRSYLDSKLGWKYPDEYYFTWELGKLYNLNRTVAVGAAMYMGVDGQTLRFGFKPRIRYWLKYGFSLDLAAGVLFASYDPDKCEKYPGFTGHLGVNLGQWISLISQVEVFRVQRSTPISPQQPNLLIKDTQVSWYNGIKLNADAGLMTGVGALILVPIMINLRSDPVVF